MQFITTHFSSISTFFERCKAFLIKEASHLTIISIALNVIESFRSVTSKALGAKRVQPVSNKPIVRRVNNVSIQHLNPPFEIKYVQTPSHPPTDVANPSMLRGKAIEIGTLFLGLIVSIGCVVRKYSTANHDSVNIGPIGCSQENLEKPFMHDFNTLPLINGFNSSGFSSKASCPLGDFLPPNRILDNPNPITSTLNIQPLTNSHPFNVVIEIGKPNLGDCVEPVSKIGNISTTVSSYINNATSAFSSGFDIMQKKTVEAIIGAPIDTSTGKPLNDICNALSNMTIPNSRIALPTILNTLTKSGKPNLGDCIEPAWKVGNISMTVHSCVNNATNAFFSGGLDILKKTTIETLSNVNVDTPTGELLNGVCAALSNVTLPQSGALSGLQNTAGKILEMTFSKAIELSSNITAGVPSGGDVSSFVGISPAYSPYVVSAATVSLLCLAAFGAFVYRFKTAKNDGNGKKIPIITNLIPPNDNDMKKNSIDEKSNKEQVNIANGPIKEETASPGAQKAGDIFEIKDNINNAAEANVDTIIDKDDIFEIKNNINNAAEANVDTIVDMGETQFRSSKLLTIVKTPLTSSVRTPNKNNHLSSPTKNSRISSPSKNKCLHQPKESSIITIISSPEKTPKEVIVLTATTPRSSSPPKKVTKKLDFSSTSLNNTTYDFNDDSSDDSNSNPSSLLTKSSVANQENINCTPKNDALNDFTDDEIEDLALANIIGLKVKDFIVLGPADKGQKYILQQFIDSETRLSQFLINLGNLKARATIVAVLVKLLQQLNNETIIIFENELSKIFPQLTLNNLKEDINRAAQIASKYSKIIFIRDFSIDDIYIVKKDEDYVFELEENYPPDSSSFSEENQSEFYTISKAQFTEQSYPTAIFLAPAFQGQKKVGEVQRVQETSRLNLHLDLKQFKDQSEKIREVIQLMFARALASPNINCLIFDSSKSMEIFGYPFDDMREILSQEINKFDEKQINSAKPISLIILTE